MLTGHRAICGHAAQVSVVAQRRPGRHPGQASGGAGRTAHDVRRNGILAQSWAAALAVPRAVHAPASLQRRQPPGVQGGRPGGQAITAGTLHVHVRSMQQHASISGAVQRGGAHKARATQRGNAFGVAMFALMVLPQSTRSSLHERTSPDACHEQRRVYFPSSTPSPERLGTFPV